MHTENHGGALDSWQDALARGTAKGKTTMHTSAKFSLHVAKGPSRKGECASDSKSTYTNKRSADLGSGQGHTPGVRIRDGIQAGFLIANSVATEKACYNQQWGGDLIHSTPFGMDADVHNFSRSEPSFAKY